jgi:hypothetical protein
MGKKLDSIIDSIWLYKMVYQMYNELFSHEIEVENKSHDDKQREHC